MFRFLHNTTSDGMHISRVRDANKTKRVYGLKKGVNIIIFRPQLVKIMPTRCDNVCCRPSSVQTAALAPSCSVRPSTRVGGRRHSRCFTAWSPKSLTAELLGSRKAPAAPPPGCFFLSGPRGRDRERHRAGRARGCDRHRRTRRHSPPQRRGHRGRSRSRSRRARQCRYETTITSIRTQIQIIAAALSQRIAAQKTHVFEVI